MKDKLTITIHGQRRGIKQFHLDSAFKRVLYIGLFALFVMISGGIFSIVYLNESLHVSQEEEAFARNEYEQMKQTHDELYDYMNQVQSDLHDKEEELYETHSRLEQIEMRMGMQPAKELPLAERINIAEINSEQMARLLQFIPNGSPVEYKGITSKFGYRTHPKLGTREFHRGTDMKAKMNTPVYATADAVVEYAGYHKSSGYGNLVILSHNYGFRTYFGHLNKVAVKSGTYIKKGELIGYTGNSGLSNGPHLHYEVRYIQMSLNPYWFVKWTPKNMQQIFEKESKVPWQSLIAAMTPPYPKTTTPLSLRQEQNLAVN